MILYQFLHQKILLLRQELICIHINLAKFPFKSHKYKTISIIISNFHNHYCIKPSTPWLHLHYKTDLVAEDLHLCRISLHQGEATTNSFCRKITSKIIGFREKYDGSTTSKLIHTVIYIMKTWAGGTYQWPHDRH